MGNLCEFQSDTIVASFDNHLQQNSFQRASMRPVNLAATSSMSLERQFSLHNIKSNTLLVPHSESRKYLANHQHRISIIPPSQHSISKFKKLEEQSQVPSDFFDHVDFSIYFQTFRNLKENISHQFFHNGSQNGFGTAKILQSCEQIDKKCNSQNGNSFRNYDECNQGTEEQKNDEEKENKIPAGLKKTKFALREIEIIRQ